LSFKVWTDEVQDGAAMSGGDLAAAPGDGSATATHSTEPEVPAVLGTVRSVSTGQAL